MKLLKIMFLLVILSVVLIIAHIVYLYTLTPTEKFPIDTYLTKETNKTALIVVAHDDDAAMFSGTTSMLVENGWDVNLICFYNNKYRPEEVPIRKKEISNVAKIQHLKNLNFIDFSMRKSLEKVKQPWLPIPYTEFPENFYMDSLNKFIQNAVLKYQPSVIFSLDDVIGGYGHPEHVLVGQTVVDICKSWKDSLNFPVKRIYQNVWPESQSIKIMGDKGVYKMGKEVYKCAGMPTPDVEIDISKYADKKMDVLLAHASQHRNLKKFMPFYNYYPSGIYFGIFNKEHFKIIDVKDI